MKEVFDEIDNLTIPFELDFEKGNAKKEVMDIEFDNPKELLFDYNSCFDQLGYQVDVNDEKGEEVIIQTEEEKKVNEIKDIDELIKYIEGDTKTKKKKKKKKKKEDPIDILLKLKEEKGKFIVNNRDIYEGDFENDSLQRIGHYKYNDNKYLLNIKENG